MVDIFAPVVNNKANTTVTQGKGKTKMINFMKRFAKDESGATAIEYGLIAALIALAIVSGATMLGDTLDNQFKFLSDELKDAQDYTPSGG